MNPTLLRSTDGGYPLRLRERLGEHSPPTIAALGNLAPLSRHKIALFCSVRCPGDAILGAYDSARKLRDDGLTVASGFHSPVEKECLRILLRGTQPVIICLARAFGKIRIPTDWRRGLDSGRVLIITPFEKWPPRPTVESARQRNELVAAVADKSLIVHASPGGQIEEISHLVDRWGMTRWKLQD